MGWKAAGTVGTTWRRRAARCWATHSCGTLGCRGAWLVWLHQGRGWRGAGPGACRGSGCSSTPASTATTSPGTGSSRWARTPTSYFRETLYLEKIFVKLWMSWKLPQNFVNTFTASASVLWGSLRPRLSSVVNSGPVNQISLRDCKMRS